MATLDNPVSCPAIRRSRISPVLKACAKFGLPAMTVAIFAAAAVLYLRPLWAIDELLHARLKLAGIDSRFVNVGPYRVHYFVGGHGTPLVLIHGLGSRSEDWTPEMPAYVKSGFRVYAIDLLGCGRTDHPDIAYTIQQQTNLVSGFLKAIHVQNADIIGWSMGGWVALQLAVQNPQVVRRLVVMDSAGLSFKTNLTPEIFEPHTIPELERLESLLVERPPRVPAFFNHALLKAMQRNFPVVHRTVQSMQTGKDLLDGQLGGIQAPVLIVWGQQDALIPPSVGLQMQRAMPQAVLEIYSDCGHIGPATCAGRIVPRVIQFLRSEPAPQGGMHLY